MRTLQHLFSVLCLSLISVAGLAQVAPTTGKLYRIKDNTNNVFLTIKEQGVNHTGANGSVAVLAEEERNADQAWELVAVDGAEKQYKFKSRSGYYLKFWYWNCNNTSSADEANTVTIAEADVKGTYYLKNGASFFKVETVNGVKYPFCDAPADHTNVVTWSFFEVPESEYPTQVTVTYKYVIGDREYTSVNVSQDPSSAINVPAQPFLTVVDTEGTIGDEDCTITVNCIEDLPFAVSADVSNAKWQLVEMHRNSTYRFWEYQADQDVNVKVVDYQANKFDVVADNKLWCFVGNMIDGFKIYNKAAGNDVTLNATGGNAKVGTAASGNDSWYLGASTATSGANVVCFTNDKSNYMNQQGGQLAYWGATDNGSTCYIYQPKEVVMTAVANVAGVVNSTIDIPTGAVGVIDKTSEAATSFQTTYTIVSAEENPNSADLVNLMQLGKELLATVTGPTAGYYFVYGTGTGNNAEWRLTYDGTKCFALPQGTGELAPQHVWSFDPIDGEDGFKLKSCNLGKYLSLVAAAAASDITSDFAGGHKFVFTSDGAGRFIIKNGNGNVVRTEGSGAINYWSYENNETWYLVPANLDIDIVIGTAGYATAYLPFDATLPEGLNAYTLTSTTNETATLTEVEDIKEHEGVILKGAANTYSLTIGTASADFTGNLLKGSIFDSYIDGGYVLSNGTSGVGLYPATLNKDADGADGDTHFKNNAGKAYLPASAVPAPSRFFIFDFGTETGIDNIDGTENTNGSAVMYDLSGRRVQKPVKGSMYIKNGVKYIHQ